MALLHPVERAARDFGRGVLDLLFPPLCVACRAPVAEPHSLCSACWQAIGFLDGPCCARCGYPFDFDVGSEMLCASCLAKPPAFDRARAALRYDDKSRDLILAFKRADRHDLVPLFARWLARAGRSMLDEAQIVGSVLLHPTRLWMRRYNQSALLAQALAGSGPLAADPFLLRRTRATPSQGAMPSARARRRNVAGAFRVGDPAAVRDRSIVLIDDVYTTGATVEACARALKKAGAARVCVLTLARVVRAASRAI